MYRKIKIGDHIQKGEILYVNDKSISMNSGDKYIVKENITVTSRDHIKGIDPLRGDNFKNLHYYKLCRKANIETLSIF